MATTIKILPSGRTFTSEGNSTLLEAGLRSGLALDYACSNGNCGQCLAKIVSGEVHKVRHHDYVIDEEQRSCGHVLMCCNSAVTDVVLEADEAKDSTDLPLQQMTARVKNIEIANGNVALVHLKTPRSKRLRFLAGQHVRLGGNNMPAADHAISSCPCDDMNLHFQIPRSSGDEFSDFVFNQLRKGAQVDINGPHGDFVLDDDSKRPLVFIAWSTGFAPVRSLIEHAQSLDNAQSIRLVWITESKEDRYLDNLCRAWNDAFDNFHYFPVDARMEEAVADGAATIELLNINPADLPAYDFYVAGSEVFSENYQKLLGGVDSSVSDHVRIFQI